MTVSAKQVMDLRAATGMPMMKCKKALEAEDGDYEKAVERLRKEGLKAADVRADRTTAQGLVRVRICDEANHGHLIGVSCETEPVANTPMFVEFVDQLVEHVIAKKPSSIEELMGQNWILDESITVEEVLRGLIARIGENMKITAIDRVALDGPGLVSSYVHFDKRQGALIALSSENVTDELRELGHKACMHVVFAKPTALTRSEISEAVADKEREIYLAQMREDPKMAGKPEQVLDKIVDGKMSSFFQQSVLEEQEWSGPESSESVAKVLAGKGAKIQAFRHVSVG
jgi:elongation factor Ts